jgi:RNA polymerase sigma-70 factor (ECF subfamily)
LKQPAGEITISPESASADLLIAGVRQRDEEACREFVNAYRRLVALIVGRMVARPQDVEDLCQEVFLKIFRSIRTFRGQSKLSTWVGRIAYNACLNHLKRKREIPVESAEYLEKVAHRERASPSTPMEILEKRDLIERIQQEMDSLDHRARTILTLYHNAGMTYEEICQVMQLPMGTVKNYLHRARRKLKEKLFSPDLERRHHES